METLVNVASLKVTVLLQLCYSSKSETAQVLKCSSIKSKSFLLLPLMKQYNSFIMFAKIKKLSQNNM